MPRCNEVAVAVAGALGKVPTVFAEYKLMFDLLGFADPDDVLAHGLVRAIVITIFLLETIFDAAFHKHIAVIMNALGCCCPERILPVCVTDSFLYTTTANILSFIFAAGKAFLPEVRKLALTNLFIGMFFNPETHNDAINEIFRPGSVFTQWLDEITNGFSLLAVLLTPRVLNVLLSLMPNKFYCFSVLGACLGFLADLLEGLPLLAYQPFGYIAVAMRALSPTWFATFEREYIEIMALWGVHANSGFLLPYKVKHQEDGSTHLQLSGQRPTAMQQCLVRLIWGNIGNNIIPCFRPCVNDRSPAMEDAIAWMYQIPASIFNACALFTFVYTITKHVVHTTGGAEGVAEAGITVNALAAAAAAVFMIKFIACDCFCSSGRDSREMFARPAVVEHALGLALAVCDEDVKVFAFGPTISDVSTDVILITGELLHIAEGSEIFDLTDEQALLLAAGLVGLCMGPEFVLKLVDKARACCCARGDRQEEESVVDTTAGTYGATAESFLLAHAAEDDDVRASFVAATV